MDTTMSRLPILPDPRRLGLAMLLGRGQADAVLAYRVAQRLAAIRPRLQIRAA